MRLFLLLIMLISVQACDDSNGGDGDGDADVDSDADADGDGAGDAFVCPEDWLCCEDVECSDGIFCNGIEVCDRGICESDPDAYCTPSGICELNCDDSLTCTEDHCNELSNLCEHRPVHDECDDGDSCNGVERCDPGDDEADEEGCVTGIAMVCDDGDDCTQDYCEDNDCRVRLRDGDGDGHGDRDCEICLEEDVCERGDDCDDGDSDIYPGAEEICDDGKDNNCDRNRDYVDPACTVPNDDCETALELRSGVRVHSSTRGMVADIEEGCGPTEYRDVAFFFALPAERDVEIDVFAISGQDIFITITPDCSSGDMTIACEPGRRFSFVRRALPAGTYHVVVAAGGEVDFSIMLTATEPEAGPEGDHCTTARAISGDGRPITASFEDVRHDYSTSCTGDPLLDLVYELTVPTEQTMDFSVASESGTGIVSFALQEVCGLSTSERGCWRGEGETSGRIWRIRPGTYTLLVGHDEEGSVDVTVNFSPIDRGLYLFEDFSSAPSGWTLSGAFAQGTPTGAGGEPTPDAGGCIATTFGGLYPANMRFTSDYAQTPVVDLRGAAAPELRFRSWLRSSTRGDGMHVEISTDGGERWTVLDAEGMSPVYDGFVSGSRAWIGEHGSWADYSIPLSEHIGGDVAFRFAAFSDFWDHYPGWYIDNVMVIDP